MSANHLLPLHYRIPFVKGQEDEDQPSTSAEPPSAIDGLEAYNFYQEVLAMSEVKRNIIKPEKSSTKKCRKDPEKFIVKKQEDSDIEIIDDLTGNFYQGLSLRSTIVFRLFLEHKTNFR